MAGPGYEGREKLNLFMFNPSERNGLQEEGTTWLVNHLRDAIQRQANAAYTALVESSGTPKFPLPCVVRTEDISSGLHSAALGIIGCNGTRMWCKTHWGNNGTLIRPNAIIRCPCLCHALQRRAVFIIKILPPLLRPLTIPSCKPKHVQMQRERDLLQVPHFLVGTLQPL